MSLEVITGPMFSGKSEELIRRLHRVEIGGRDKVFVCKPAKDTRDADVSSRNGLFTESVGIEDVTEITRLAFASDAGVVAIDEAQFFGMDLIPVVKDLLRNGRRVIVAGLDLSFQEEPFEVMAHLLTLATRVDKLTAVCKSCGTESASRSKRIVASTEHILVGDKEYEAQCIKCFHTK